MAGVEELWTDSFAIYRMTHDSKNDPLGVALISSGHACKAHLTPNYDEQRGAVQIKEDSLETSDSLAFAIGIDVRSNDFLKVTLSTGAIDWVRVKGAPQTRTLIPHRRVFVSTIPAPTIV